MALCADGGCGNIVDQGRVYCMRCTEEHKRDAKDRGEARVELRTILDEIEEYGNSRSDMFLRDYVMRARDALERL